MNNIRVVVSNSPTKIPTMKNALYGGMAPPKKGKMTVCWFVIGYFINYYLRDDKIDVSFESDVTGAPFITNEGYYKETVMVLDMLMAILQRKAPAKDKAKL